MYNRWADTNSQVPDKRNSTSRAQSTPKRSLLFLPLAGNLICRDIHPDVYVVVVVLHPSLHASSILALSSHASGRVDLIRANRLPRPLPGVRDWE